MHDKLNNNLFFSKLLKVKLNLTKNQLRVLTEKEELCCPRFSPLCLRVRQQQDSAVERTQMEPEKHQHHEAPEFPCSSYSTRSAMEVSRPELPRAQRGEL